MFSQDFLWVILLGKTASTTKYYRHCPKAFGIIIKKPPLDNGNSPIVHPITEMGVAHAL